MSSQGEREKRKKMALGKAVAERFECTCVDLEEAQIKEDEKELENSRWGDADEQCCGNEHNVLVEKISSVLQG